MIPIKQETNYLMDWSDSQDQINYFKNLRTFLAEIESLSHIYPSEVAAQGIKKCFERWNVYFIDADEIPRVNLDAPGGGAA